MVCGMESLMLRWIHNYLTKRSFLYLIFFSRYQLLLPMTAIRQINGVFVVLHGTSPLLSSRSRCSVT